MRLRHEQAQRLCRAVSIQPAPRSLSATASNAMLATPPLLTHDSAAQLHEITDQPTSGAVSLANVGAASLATAPALQAPAVGVLGTAPCAPLLEPRNVPLLQRSDSEDMDTTTTRKRLRPSEPGSDDEGASRKLQAVGLAPNWELTPNSPSRVAGLSRASAHHCYC
ncbi:hypothetical protein MTO96_032651 [Rhipicephalus appendiculatus]